MSSHQPADSERAVPTEESANSDFLNAKPSTDHGFVREFLSFLVENKKWWMAPFFVVLGLLLLIAFLGSTPVAPFIYSLF